MTAVILMALSGICIFLALCLFLVPSAQWTIILTIIGMILGNYALNHLEKYAELKPRSPFNPEVEHIESKFKNGNPVNIHVQLCYPADQDAPHILRFIGNHLQSTLNAYLSKIEKLSDDPYREIDAVLAAQETTLRSELGLRDIKMNAIDIQTSSSPPEQGIYLKTS